MTAARRIAVATGSRADFGLLNPVMQAIDDHPNLDLRVLVAGAHLLPPELTVREVAAAFDVAARIPMQEPGTTSRGCDAEALGRGVTPSISCLTKSPFSFDHFHLCFWTSSGEGRERKKKTEQAKSNDC